jgi:hypothetical protein
MIGPVDVQVNDVVRLRKPHPCGGYEWQVTRIGADIGLKCLTCGRRVLLDRPTFNKRVKAVVRKQTLGVLRGTPTGGSGPNP